MCDDVDMLMSASDWNKALGTPHPHMEFSDAVTLWSLLYQDSVFMGFARSYRITDEWIINTPKGAPPEMKEEDARYNMWCQRGSFFANLLHLPDELTNDRIAFVVQKMIEKAPGLLRAWGIATDDPWVAMTQGISEKEAEALTAVSRTAARSKGLDPEEIEKIVVPEQEGYLLELAYFLNNFGAALVNGCPERPEGSASMVIADIDSFRGLDLGIVPGANDPVDIEEDIQISVTGPMSADEREARGFSVSDNPPDQPSSGI